MARILIVDDNRDMVATMAELLQVIGHRTKGCYGGQEALDRIDEFDPDVVLMDLAMPGMDGWHAAKAIRAKHPGKRPLLIAISGEYMRGPDKERGGFDCYLVKPPDLNALEALLARTDTA